MGARLAGYVHKSLTRPVTFQRFWTDSSCVRNRVRSTAAYYKPFVSHRIGEINTRTELDEWRFVPGSLNVIDAATRSSLIPGYVIPETWGAGPAFLNPVILPRRHPLTEKIIEAFHQSLHHMGTDYLITHVHQHFWTVRGREIAKKIKAFCPECMRERAKPTVQLMGDLPGIRLDAYAPPFSGTALDYFWPIEVGLACNRTAKRYGALFTCLVTRAVYVDLATSLSTDDFLLVFRRFVSTYGHIRTIHSDNGTKFVGAERDLLVENNRLNEEAPTRTTGIDWKFQPPSAPHFGGAHESLVKPTKTALYRLLRNEKAGHRYPTEDILRTLLFEVAGLLNSRPLTYASSDPDDFRPLTPNDFLNCPVSPYSPSGYYSDPLPKELYRYLQRSTNHLWDFWKTSYLQSIVGRQKWKLERRNFRTSLEGNGISTASSM